jgi:hypothetical protein
MDEPLANGSAAASALSADEAGWTADGPEIRIANEFAMCIVQRARTRNGSRLMVRSELSGRVAFLDPVALEALTGITPEQISEIVATETEGGAPS